MAKTVSFGIVHLTVAFTVAYLLTGSIAISGAITLVEPLCNTVAFHFFDKYWGRSSIGRRIRSVADRLGARAAALRASAAGAVAGAAR